MRMLYVILFISVFSFTQKAQTFGVYTPTVIGTNSQYVRIITKAVFSSVGARLGHSFLIDYFNNIIHLRSCYVPDGILLSNITFIDTVNIGILYQGNYTLDYVAYYSSSYSDCMPYDTIIKPPYQFHVGPNSIEELNDLQKIQLAPNPVKNNFKIQCNDDGINLTKICIFNSVGQKVQEYLEPKFNSEIYIDISPGIYFLEISSGTRSRTIKFIKE